MNNSNIALITALYDSQGADFYKEIYFPIIKYAIAELLGKSNDNQKYCDIPGLHDVIEKSFGIKIPMLVIKQSVRALSLTKSDFIIKLFDKNDYFKVEKMWDMSTKNDIDLQAERVRNNFHRLTLTFIKYLSDNNLTCEKRIIDLINDCSIQSLNILEQGSCKETVGEEYANMAAFIEKLKTYDIELYTLVEQVYWSSIIAGFLKRSKIDLNVKVEENVNYYIDSTLVLSILDLDEECNVSYARDLLRIIQSAGCAARVHPLTLREIEHILKSVEHDQQPRPGTGIESAWIRWGSSQLSKILSIRTNLVSKLEKDYNISCLPTMTPDELDEIERKYSAKNKVQTLHREWDSRSEDLFREIHDIYLIDYVSERNSNYGLTEKFGTYFVTTNSGLVEFAKPSSGPSSVITSGQVIMNLWLHSNNCSILKQSALTEMISRCYALNQVSVRRKLCQFMRYHDDCIHDQSEYNAMYRALVQRSNRTLSDIDKIAHIHNNKEQNQEKAYILAKGLVEYNKTQEEIRKELEKNESERNKELQLKIEKLNTTIAELDNSNSEREKELAEKIEEITEKDDSLKELSKEFQRYKKENELIKRKDEIKNKIDEIEKNAKKSICFTKFWLNISVEVIVGLAIIVFVLFFFINLFKTNEGIVTNIILPGLGLLFMVAKGKSNSIYIGSPCIKKWEIEKEQLNYFYNKHPEYQNLKEQISLIEKELNGL